MKQKTKNPIAKRGILATGMCLLSVSPRNITSMDGAPILLASNKDNPECAD